MSACIIALSLGFLALGLGMNEDLACDRQIVNNEAAVQATLLDYGDYGTNPFVRHETTVVPLAYPCATPVPTSREKRSPCWSIPLTRHDGSRRNRRRTGNTGPGVGRLALGPYLAFCR